MLYRPDQPVQTHPTYRVAHTRHNVSTFCPRLPEYPNTMTTFLFGLVLFLGIHSIRIVAPGVRAAVVSNQGEMAWKGVYALLALAGFVLLVMGWPEARATSIVLWTPPSWTRHLTMLLMLPVLPLLLATFLTGRIQFLLKHPTLVATKLWATAHLLSNGQLHEVLLFGGFLVWAVADRISVKRRPGAVLPRPCSWNIKDAIAVVVGVALYGLLVVKAHGWLFGMPLTSHA